MPNLETAEPESRTPAQLDFDRLLALWEGKPNPTGGQTEDGYYLEIAGGLIVALSDQLGDLRGDIAQIRSANAMRDQAFTKLDDCLTGLIDYTRRIRSDVNALTGSGPTIAAESKPTIRVRIQLSSTVKDGHRVSETTVEWTGTGAPQFERMEEAGRLAYDQGSLEAARRNMVEAASSS